MRVGFVGCGTMGEHMARNVVGKGHELSVYDVDVEPLRRLQEDGASIKQRPADVASDSEVVVLMVVNDRQVRDVIAGENGLLEELRPGGVIVVMSTVTPGVCVEMAEAARAAGGDLMEAPVVLSQPAAIAGELGIYLGGAPETCEKAMPVLRCMGKNIIRMGDVGQAMAMKLCHNMMTATIAQGVSEMIALGAKAGLDFDDMVTAISYGGGQNFFLQQGADDQGAGLRGPLLSRQHEQGHGTDAGLRRRSGRQYAGRRRRQAGGQHGDGGGHGRGGLLGVREGCREGIGSFLGLMGRVERPNRSNPGGRYTSASSSCA